MNKLRFAMVLLMLAVPVLSGATVLTFGPICSGDCAVAVPAGYGGFTWDPNAYVVGNVYFDSNYGNTYGAPSGGALYNGFGASPFMISSATPFTFNGADVSTWAEFDSYAGFSSTTITINAYDSSMHFLGSVETTLSPTGYTFLGANIANVSNLVIWNDCNPCSGRWWVLDDLTYNQSNNGVPEPGTLGLMASGLLGGIGMIRRRLTK